MDLHVHSAHSSDGSVSPAGLVREASRRGLKGLALTDHNSVGGLEQALETAGDIPGFMVVPGLEVSSAGGHVLAYGVRAVIKEGMSVEATVEAVLSAGGLPVAPHPFRSFTGVGEKAVRGAGFRAVEVLNARSPARKNARARRLCEELGLGRTAGSDCHRLRELGWGYTVLPEEPPGWEEVLELIRKGRSLPGGRSASFREVVGHSSKIGKDLLGRGGKRI